MKIRKAKKSELKEIALLMKKELGKPPYNEKESINNVIKSLAFYFKIGEIYVYLIEKEIAGVVVCKIEQYWEGKVIIIEDLIVKHEFKRKGIGKELMKFVEDYAKKKKIKSIYFSTNKDAEAVGFYEKIGYVKSNKTIFMRKKQT